MKKLLTYLLFVIIAAITFIGEASETNSGIVPGLEGNAIAVSVSHTSDSWVSDASLYLPVQSSGTNVFRVPSIFQRTHTVHKNPFEFIKVNKMALTGIRHFINKKSLIVYATFIKSAHRLACLGKFLI